MNLWNPGDVFIVSKKQTWVGIIVPSTIINSIYSLVKLIYRDTDTQFNKRPHANLVYSAEKLPGLTKIKTLKKYQRSLLKQTLKLALENGNVDNLEYIEALNTIKEIK